MSNEKFTRGEWSVQQNSSYLEIVSTLGAIGEVCMSGHVFDGGDCLNGKTTVANANLIAAAPDIYRVLKKILSSHYFDRYGAECDAEDAREALAKARGEL